jgi:hypothetical protein
VALEIVLLISGKNYHMTKQLALAVRIHENKGISICIDRHIGLCGTPASLPLDRFKLHNLQNVSLRHA